MLQMIKAFHTLQTLDCSPAAQSLQHNVSPDIHHSHLKEIVLLQIVGLQKYSLTKTREILSTD